MQSVEIKTTDVCGHRFTKVLVGGNELKNVKGIEFSQCVGEVPEFVLETCGYPNIMVDNALVEFRFDIETLENALGVIRRQLMYDKDFYNGLKDIIKDALMNTPADSGFDAVATKILDDVISLE